MVGAVRAYERSSLTRVVFAVFGTGAAAAFDRDSAAPE